MKPIVTPMKYSYSCKKKKKKKKAEAESNQVPRVNFYLQEL